MLAVKNFFLPAEKKTPVDTPRFSRMPEAFMRSMRRRSLRTKRTKSLVLVQEKRKSGECEPVLYHRTFCFCVSLIDIEPVWINCCLPTTLPKLRLYPVSVIRLFCCFIVDGFVVCVRCGVKAYRNLTEIGLGPGYFVGFGYDVWNGLMNMHFMIIVSPLSSFWVR